MPCPNDRADIAATALYSQPGPRDPRRKDAERRLSLLAIVIAFQLIALKLTLHPRTEEFENYDRSYQAFGAVFQPALYFFAALGVLLSARLATFWHGLLAHTADYSWRRYLVPQLLCYVSVIVAAAQLMPTDYATFTGQEKKWELAWASFLLLSAVAMILYSMLLLAPPRYWRYFVSTERFVLMLALLFCVGACTVSYAAQRSWNVLGEPTMRLSRMILSAMYSDVHADFAALELGTGSFVVQINYQCSGYEGLGLMIAFLTWYLLALRSELRFPNALLLLPLGMAVIWLLNALRIALLIAIGSSVSRDVAMNGFHSNAGWISFVGVCLGVAYIAHRAPFFSKSASAPRIPVDQVSASAIPMLILLAATLVSGSFSTAFPWLYPLRVLVVGAVIVLLWPHFGFGNLRIAPFPVLVGTVVFGMWIALVAPAPEKSLAFKVELFSVSGTISAGWIIFRMLGAMIIVPIAEELAFRRYLLSFFIRDRNLTSKNTPAPWIAILLSSILFGLLHHAWLAGALAGFAYYAAMKRSGRLWDAVVAHMTTNALLCVYVLLFDQWSYW